MRIPCSLLLLAVSAGCTGRSSDAAKVGPLQDRIDYVLCLREQGNPKEATAVLREKGAGRAPRFHGLRPKDRLELKDPPKLAIWVISVEPSGIVYEDASNFDFSYRLMRATAGGSEAVPAGILAAFAGNSMEKPVLYDSRTGFADRLVSVPGHEEVIEVKRAMGLLAGGGMALEEVKLGNGRSFFLWRSADRTGPAKKEKASSREPALLIERDESSSGRLGKKFNISSGVIDLMDFLQASSDLRGLPVVSREEPSSLQGRKIRMLMDIEGVDQEILSRILELNGVLVEESALPSGEKALLAHFQE